MKSPTLLPARAGRMGRGLALACALLVFAAAHASQALNEKATADAWAAFGADKFEAAIKSADQCIEEFRGAALRLQEKLEKAKADVPLGKVSDDQKKKVFENGLLNDVATCYFIKGRAAEKLGRMADAKRAYGEAKKLTYARTWDDDNKWFWSPAEGAEDRLAGMH